MSITLFWCSLMFVLDGFVMFDVCLMLLAKYHFNICKVSLWYCESITWRVVGNAWSATRQYYAYSRCSILDVLFSIALLVCGETQFVCVPTHFPSVSLCHNFMIPSLIELCQFLIFFFDILDILSTWVIVCAVLILASANQNSIGYEPKSYFTLTSLTVWWFLFV